MAQIITWNKEDDTYTVEREVLLEDGETTEVQEVTETQPLSNVAIYSFDDDLSINIGETQTVITDANGVEQLVISDVRTDNSHLYTGVDNYPEENFYGYKYRYTSEDGWSEQLDTWIDPAAFSEGPTDVDSGQ